MATNTRRTSKKTPPEEVQQATPEVSQEVTPEVQPEAPTPVVKERNASTVASPVKRVWEIADSMPGAKRKEIIAECIAQGIAFYTARTQYQKWSQSKKASAL